MKTVGNETSALDNIRTYMTAVSECITSGGTPPLGYCQEDKDGGYRSAMRFHGIDQTPETDAHATMIIYQRDRDENYQQ